MNTIAYKEKEFTKWEELEIRKIVQQHVYAGHVGNIEKYKEEDRQRHLEKQQQKITNQNNHKYHGEDYDHIEHTISQEFDL